MTTKTMLSPQLGALITKMADVADLDTALVKILLEYLELKIADLERRVGQFETKWGMTFEEFSQRLEEGTLGQNAFDYAVESDFWDWEAAVTLLQHYRALRQQWT